MAILQSKLFEVLRDHALNDNYYERMRGVFVSKALIVKSLVDHLRKGPQESIKTAVWLLKACGYMHCIKQVEKPKRDEDRDNQICNYLQITSLHKLITLGLAEKE